MVDCPAGSYQNCQRLIAWTFVIWLYLRRNAFYPRVRNTIIALDVIGLLGYWLYPTAPPRLTPGYGFVDVLDPTQANLRSSLVGSLTNLYAAVPSLHTAYALLIGITGYRACRAPRRRACSGRSTPCSWCSRPSSPATTGCSTPSAGARALALAWTAVSRAAALQQRGELRRPAPRREIRSRTAGLRRRDDERRRPRTGRPAPGCARCTPAASFGATTSPAPAVAQLARRGAVRRHQRQHRPLGREVLPRLRRDDGLGAGPLLHEQEQHVGVALRLQHHVVRLGRLDLDDVLDAEAAQRVPAPRSGNAADEPRPDAVAQRRPLAQRAREAVEERARPAVAEEVAGEQ